MEKKSFTVEEIAAHCGLEYHGDGTHLILGVEDIEKAAPSDASFISNERYGELLQDSKAGLIVAQTGSVPLEKRNYLFAKDPSKEFQKVIELFFPKKPFTGFRGIHSSAVIHESAHIGSDVTICPFAVIDEGAKIHDGVIVGAHSYIGRDTIVKKGALIYPHVTVREECEIGENVVLQPGVVIGACGYGYTQNEKGHHKKLNQQGRTVLESEVEVGANASVDRSRFGATVVGEGTKLGNSVVVAHGVKIGKHSLIIAQTGIAGSTHIGSHVILGGQCGVGGHLSICDFALVAGRAGVTKNITKPGKYGGVPAMDLNTYQRMMARLTQIHTLFAQVKEIKKQLNSIK